MVTVEEEIDLAVRIRNGDDNALKRLVEGNLRFVISVAKQFQNRGLSFPDLINEGNVGLVKAAKKFDETRGFKFISYAVWWIRQSIIQAISEQTRVVRLPLNRLTTMNQISKATLYLEQQFERDPSNYEIADFLDIREELISENNTIKNTQVSFDKPIFPDGQSDTCLYDLIVTENFPAPDNELVEESVKIDLSRALKKLTNRESSIIEMSYGLNESTVYSLHEIAFVFGMTSERVRQIRNGALFKLKKIISGKNCFNNNL